MCIRAENNAMNTGKNDKLATALPSVVKLLVKIGNTKGQWLWLCM